MSWAMGGALIMVGLFILMVVACIADYRRNQFKRNRQFIRNRELYAHKITPLFKGDRK